MKNSGIILFKSCTKKYFIYQYYKNLLNYIKDCEKCAKQVVLTYGFHIKGLHKKWLTQTQSS